MVGVNLKVTPAQFAHAQPHPSTLTPCYLQEASDVFLLPFKSLHVKGFAEMQEG